MAIRKAGQTMAPYEEGVAETGIEFGTPLFLTISYPDRYSRSILPCKTTA